MEYSALGFEQDNGEDSFTEVFLVDNEGKTEDRAVTLPYHIRLMTSDEYMETQLLAMELIKNNPDLLERHHITDEEIDKIISSLPENEQKKYEPYKRIIRGAIETFPTKDRGNHWRMTDYRDNDFRLVGGSYYSDDKAPKAYLSHSDYLEGLRERETTLSALEQEEKTIAETEKLIDEKQGKDDKTNSEG